MSKKLGEKSESRKNKKSIKKKKVLFTLGIAVFMALVTLAAVMEMSNYEYDVLDRPFQNDSGSHSVRPFRRTGRFVWHHSHTQFRAPKPYPPCRSYL